MDRSRDALLRSPFKQANISSSSLEGMERPVRSFKSFIQTVPPHPTSPPDKPLPPSPSLKQRTPSFKKSTSGTPSPPNSTPSPASLAQERTLSVASWKAPAEWYNDSSSPGERDPVPTQLIIATRTYAPLLPEPSPGMTEPNMEALWGSSPLQSARLLPIYERPNGDSDLGPPRSPPRSPLPPPPISNGRVEDAVLPLQGRSANSSPGVTGSKALPSSDLRFRTTSPANSGHTSIASSASTKEKAFASLGIGSPKQQTVIVESRPFDPESASPKERARADQQYLRGRKLRALNKGSPLSEDSWEDTEMDDKTRQLSFSQDYHDLLADQYQEMNVRPEEVLRSGPHDLYAQFIESKPKPPPKDHELIPPPLSWQKGSNGSSPRSVTPQSTSRERAAEKASTPPQKGMAKRITSWVPHRLSVAPKRQASKRNSSERSEWDGSATRKKQIPEAEVDKVLKEDLRFSMFFPSNKPLKFGKKNAMDTKTIKATKVPPLPPAPPRGVSPHQSTTPLMRLPGGLAVVRHSPSPFPKSEAASVQEASPTPDHPRNGGSPPHLGSNGHSPTSSPQSHRLSFNSRHSHSPVAPGIAIRTRYRYSTASSYSQHSGTSSPSHPLSQEIPRSSRTPPLPPPPPIPSSSPYDPPLSPEAWKQYKSLNEEDGDKKHGGFVERAKQARRKHSRDARQEKLKKSIRVLGPTDPGVVAGYVRVEGREDGIVGEGGRMPGYMTSFYHDSDSG